MHAMTYETAVDIWQGIQKTVLTELKNDVVTAAVRYARLRTDWCLADSEERAGMERGRTAAHERLIDALNILSRNMQRAGEPVDWRAALGTDRRRIGDWACLLHAHLGIMAR